LSARFALSGLACRHASASPRFQEVVWGRYGKVGSLPTIRTVD
jgi:hypothetical protein